MAAADEPVDLSHPETSSVPSPESGGTPAASDEPVDEPGRLGRLREAAIAAEYATGRQEDTEEEARRHVIIRVGTIVVGFIVLIAGLAMLVLPGQGIITVIIGLTILARELPWAERVLEYAKKKAKLDELKHQPVWIKVVAWGFTVVAIAASVWWMFFAEPKPAVSAILPWNW
ncbi:PGPGW domain-containing protein [Aquihabitans sp. McL0605]|uniref:PGPGW domain-containing protein n=1 Tax=Aquihabitans sp. McL0605 TaxID=3415671 RepID=UPI003CF42649